MNAVAAGTTDQNSDSVDMLGFEGVRFIASFGTLTSGAVTSIKAQQSSDDGSADGWSDLEGTSVSIADTKSNDVLVLDVYRPTKQHVRCVVDRGTANAVISGVIAEQYGAAKKPVTHDADSVAGSETHISPAEGTS